MTRNVTRLAATGLILLGAATVLADYTIDWSTIDAGGGTSSGGGFELTGTVGQPDATSAAALSAGGYTLTGGFWTATLPACSAFAPEDFDRDCDVDIDDFNRFKACTTGQDVPYDVNNLPTGCTFTPIGGHIAPDFDGDGDVDQDDFGQFQRCISGANLPVSGACLP